ncbi:hypothetical protein HPB48_005754 [Haemaphysalis longicornis]|uniref:Endonuclease/exonuclease/phosphatase domain-containing protein n=1 Tax=Haemaphysalis longicornis TaxID=44386 RepID=A0A9J6GM65_HAELO|nr:hypothetical protein HPB48_005754 [Haemaphysalis longicornis]
MENNLDIIAVQETKINNEEQADAMVVALTSRYYVCISHAVSSSGGCALFFKKSMGIVIENVMSCETGRFIAHDFNFSGLSFRAICLHAPNKPTERKVLFERIDLVDDIDVLVLGDYNCVCHAEDRAGTGTAHDANAELLSTIVTEHGLEGIASVMSGGQHAQCTHYQNNSHARLDRAYISANLVHACTTYEVKHVSFSDHSLVMFTLGKA